MSRNLDQVLAREFAEVALNLLEVLHEPVIMSTLYRQLEGGRLDRFRVCQNGAIPVLGQGVRVC